MGLWVVSNIPWMNEISSNSKDLFLILILNPCETLSSLIFHAFTFPPLCYSPVSEKLNCSTPTHLSRSYSNDNSEVFHASSRNHSFSKVPQHLTLLGTYHTVFWLLLSLCLSLIYENWLIISNLLGLADFLAFTDPANKHLNEWPVSGRPMARTHCLCSSQRRRLKNKGL